MQIRACAWCGGEAIWRLRSLDFVLEVVHERLPKIDALRRLICSGTKIFYIASKKFTMLPQKQLILFKARLHAASQNRGIKTRNLSLLAGLDNCSNRRNRKTLIRMKPKSVPGKIARTAIFADNEVIPHRLRQKKSRLYQSLLRNHTKAIMTESPTPSSFKGSSRLRKKLLQSKQNHLAIPKLIR